MKEKILELTIKEKKSQILNISVDNISKQELLKKIEYGGFIVTLNVDHLMKLQKDPEFLKAYEEADYVVCDSKIIQLLSSFLGNKIQEKISGSDFFSDFYTYYKSDPDTRIFLLGGAKGVAKKAQEIINKKCAKEIVVEVHSPSFGFEKDERECQKIVELINHSNATVLAIGVGAPKQEKWIKMYKHQLKNIKIFLAIGATINFEAGSLRRAPKWMSDSGLEWFFRLCMEPRRLWKRYLIDAIPFFGLVLQQKLNLYTAKDLGRKKLDKF